MYSAARHKELLSHQTSIAQKVFGAVPIIGTENGTLTVYNSKDDTLLVTRGCFFGSPAEFLEKSKRVHDARTHHEYKLLIEVATSRIEAAQVAVKTIGADRLMLLED